MKLRIAAVIGALSVAEAQSQTVTTWFSTSAVSLGFVSSWRVVHYGSTPVTPIPTSRPGPIYETNVIYEPTKSRNINITATQYSTQATLPISTELRTVRRTVLGVYTVSSNGTGTATSWVTPTVATVTFRPKFCAGNASAPKTTITQYTGEYTPFPGQLVTETRTAFPTAVTSHVKVIYQSHVFPFTGTTVSFTSIATVTSYLSTTTLTTTHTTTLFPRDPLHLFPYTVTIYPTTTTTTISSPYLAHTALPTTIPCPPDSTLTVTHHLRCAPSNLISSQNDRGVAIRWDSEKWVIPLTSRFNSDLFADATKDPSVCCQLCVDNEGCAGGEWKRDWGDGCRLYYYFGHFEDGGGEKRGDGGNGTMETGMGRETCGLGQELEYYADEDRWPGQASFVHGGCGRLGYGGVKSG
ncbi:hypothetical protein B0T14DRAFT_491986 [Immersiella caudata]|uniref:Uncharacterized protein n=1 Tax=Immersiella caudata TaxID=314043 RepID=A0AA39XH44_9PEZI|nr:hypothetical protein B0T14DRAFT_491986 [Immersiella caudata]